MQKRQIYSTPKAKMYSAKIKDFRVITVVKAGLSEMPRKEKNMLLNYGKKISKMPWTWTERKTNIHY